MDVNPIKYNNFNINNLSIVDNNLKYLDDDVYIYTPTLKIADICDINNKTYLKLKVNTNYSGICFINNILELEIKIKNILNNKNYINSQIVRDIYDNIFIKVKIINVNNNIFDINKNLISYNTLKKSSNVKCVIKMTNLYQLPEEFKLGYSFELYQLMLLK
jgi:hypothetical protein